MLAFHVNYPCWSWDSKLIALPFPFCYPVFFKIYSKTSSLFLHLSGKHVKIKNGLPSWAQRRREGVNKNLRRVIYLNINNAAMLKVKLASTFYHSLVLFNLFSIEKQNYFLHKHIFILVQWFLLGILLNFSPNKILLYLTMRKMQSWRWEGYKFWQKVSEFHQL